MKGCKACRRCGLIHRLPGLGEHEWAACVRCGAVIHEPGRARLRARTTAAFALGALVLFLPAILLPILRIERLGFRSESGILTGVIKLISHGNIFVGAVVLLFSIVLPLVKLLLLVELSLFRLVGTRGKALGYAFVELAGRWSMMDVLLLAFLVMLVKLGNLVEFRMGPGVVAFVLCVVMSLVASATFDPHVIWEED